MILIDKTSYYPNKIAIFYKNAESSNIKNIILHLHGHRTFRKNLNRVETFQDILNEFNFNELLSQTNLKDAILIVPASIGKCDTYKEYLSSIQGFDAFLNSIFLEVLQPKKMHIDFENLKITLSGHSGSYNPIAQILKDNNINESKFFHYVEKINLFDALYGEIETYSNFIKNNKIKFNLVAVKNTKTSQNQKLLYALLNSQNNYLKLKIQNEIKIKSCKQNQEKLVCEVLIDSKTHKISLENINFIDWEPSFITLSKEKNPHWDIVKVFFNFLTNDLKVVF